MQKSQINAGNWKQAAAELVKAFPTDIYNRLKYLYGTEVPNYTPGYERNATSVMTMINIIERKALASGNPVFYLQNVL